MYFWSKDNLLEYDCENATFEYSNIVVGNLEARALSRNRSVCYNNFFAETATDSVTLHLKCLDQK